MYDGSDYGYFGGASVQERCAAVANRVREILGVPPAPASPAGARAGDGLGPGLQGYLRTPAFEGTPEDLRSADLRSADPDSGSGDADAAPTAEGPDGPPPAAKPPVSDRKLAANRANALRSTGPRSVAGKERAKLNAVKHGLWAATALLPGESAEELAALADAFDADHGGGSAAERELAGRAVAVAWRLRRLARAEERLADDAAERRRARSTIGGGGGGGGGGEAANDWPDGARVTADDFAAGGSAAAGPLQRLMAAEGRLNGQLTSVCRLLLKARDGGGTRGRS